ncbi:MAG: 50S ribosomal protein L3, partial [Fervidobacterium sp.]
LARKVGMTRLWKGDKVVPVTVLKAGPCYVVQKKTVEKDGYNAVQIGFDETKEKKLPKPLLGVFKKANVKPLRVLKEFRTDNVDQYTIGQEITVAIFEEGDKIDITGWSKGRGYSGAMKRWNFQGGPKAHGAKFHRELGSVGQHSDPARIFKGKKMPGRYGNERITVLNSEVIKIDTDNNLLAVKGGVPGARGSLVIIRSAIKV